MTNPYKVPMAQHILDRLGRLSHRYLSPAMHKVLGDWYCDSCRAYHRGNVIAYDLEYSDYYEDFTTCYSGLKCRGIDITSQPVQSHSPTLKSVAITGAQAAEVFHADTGGHGHV